MAQVDQIAITGHLLRPVTSGPVGNRNLEQFPDPKALSQSAGRRAILLTKDHQILFGFVSISTINHLF